MKFGHFDDARREYVITRPDTPLPWINYIGCENYFGIISNTAGGYSFYKDARLRRLTRYRYNNVPLDEGGRYIYLRDDGAGDAEPLYWSPSWQPVRRELDSYECRHGMGYTTISSTYQGIAAQTRYFVPLGENLEVWELTLTNQRDLAAELSVYGAVEFCLWDAWDDATNFQRNFSIGEVEVLDNVIYHKTEYRERRDHFAYFTCSEKMDAFDTQREDFLGAYRGWDRPQGVASGKLSNSIAHGWQPVGVQQVRITLQPGESRKLIFLLGYQENPAAEKFDPPGSQTLNKQRALTTIHRFLDEKVVDKAFDELHAYWQDLLGQLEVQTPDEHTNRMVNTWNAYQVMATFNFSRSASMFESGVGRGMGFRDSNQDLLAFVLLDPARSRERLLDLAATQRADGSAYHQYQPLTKRGNDGVGSGFNDDPLWLVLATAAYIRETGDWSVLREPVPFDNQAGTEVPLYTHLLRSLEFTLANLGPHELPLIGRADWNDCLNLNCFSEEPGQSFQTTTSKDGKVAESVFIAGLFNLAVSDFVDLALHEGEQDDVQRFRQAAHKMGETVWAAGWDGAWFRRAYDDFGEPVGSSQNAEGQIFIEPQGMCVMAGLGLADGRAQQALDAVAEHLATPHGIMLQQPAFSHYYLKYGEISSYPPGYKENASVFCHTNPWVMIAETKLGRGDAAFSYYQRINPSAREGISELHKCEPYVYAQMISGKDAAVQGEAKNSWLTGTAAWNFVAITQWILGIRPTVKGLCLAPVIPADWPSFKAVRVFRGVRYDIAVERVGAGNAVELEVDGKPVMGNVVPLPADGVDQVQVKVKLGS
ncbi:MAG: cellobiose phosphorylase [Chloroflexota bacterium]|nr:cellobiose phosphorylase [Chloroflexota bacterium]